MEKSLRNPSKIYVFKIFFKNNASWSRFHEPIKQSMDVWIIELPTKWKNKY